MTDRNVAGISKKVRDYKKLAQDLEIGELTLRDIVKELETPARDPREDMPKPILRSDVLEIKDLTPGMVLKGPVRNTRHYRFAVPLTGNLFSEESEWEEDWSESDEYGMPLDGTELADYEEVIREELERYGEDDLMQYFDGSESIQGKIQSAVVTIENKDGILYGCTKLELNEFLSQEELQEFTEYIYRFPNLIVYLIPVWYSRTGFRLCFLS